MKNTDRHLIINSLIDEVNKVGFAWVGANNNFGGATGRSKLKGYKDLKEIAELHINWYIKKDDDRFDRYMETEEFKNL